MALLFAVSAGVATVVPHRTGAWLPLHLFLVGALLLAISGTTRLFAVTWSAGEPTRSRVVDAQRWLVTVGAAGLAVGRELSAPVAVVAIAGLCVSASLVLLGILLVRDVRQARLRRFHVAVHAYLAAVGFGIVGTGLGAAMVTGRAPVRDAHVIVNVLGLVGLVIAGTLPSFTATQARMKMSRRATSQRLYGNLALLTAATGAAAAGALAHDAPLEGGGLVAFALGLGHLTTMLPIPGRKQLRWAGPRLLQLGLGLAWWTAAVAAAGVQVLRGGPAFSEHLVAALVLGGYLQILLASLAYLGPVLRGGGHLRLTDGFATTRSWTLLALPNVAAVAWLLGQPRVACGAVIAIVLEVGSRAGRLASPKEIVDV
jgi:nitrite reductase (NO-forming)